ncbi:MAG: hypothetical protein ACYDB1_01250 [Acidiferrobacteraceae bacterium]
MKTNDEIYEALMGVRGDFQTHCATDALHFENIYKQLGSLGVSMRASDTALFEARGRGKFLRGVSTFAIATIPTAVYAAAHWFLGHPK